MILVNIKLVFTAMKVDEIIREGMKLSKKEKVYRLWLENPNSGSRF